MGIASGIRTTVRGLIDSLGSTASLYSYANATKTTSEEGTITITNWGTASSIKVISSDNVKLKRLLEKLGEENDESGRTLLIKDNVTVGAKDKLTIGTDIYVIEGIKNIDPIEDTIILKKITLAKDARYS